MDHLTFTIPENLAGERLDKALAALAPSLSRARLQALIASGAVSPRGEAKRKVAAGETFSIALPETAPVETAAQAISLDILFEDAHLLVLNKPAGMVVHPAAGHADGTLVNALLHHCGDSLTGIGGEARPGIVHRIDKDTSGLLVVAKTQAAYAGLQPQFAAHSVERVYTCAVSGHLTPPAGKVDAPIGRSAQNRQKMAVREGGRRAVTHYRTLARLGAKASLVECRLETGRTHQIRVHMAHLGHPLLGDPVYGRARIPGFARQALHAGVLGFTHPATGERLRFQAEPPDDLNALIKRLTV